MYVWVLATVHPAREEGAATDAPLTEKSVWYRVESFDISKYDKIVSIYYYFVDVSFTLYRNIIYPIFPISHRIERVLISYFHAPALLLLVVYRSIIYRIFPTSYRIERVFLSMPQPYMGYICGRTVAPHTIARRRSPYSFIAPLTVAYIVLVGLLVGSCSTKR